MVKVFAHRGASAFYPENTLAAFREAVRVGADAIEFDVQLTRDRHLAVFHDESLQRMTGLSGRVIDWKLAAIQRVDIGKRYGPEFAGEFIPNLRQVIETIPPHILLNIHAIAHPYSREPLATTLVRTLDRMDAWDRCLISSDSQTLKLILQQHPEAAVCSLTRFPNLSDYLRRSIELGCRAVQPLRQMLKGSPSFINEAHRHGLSVHVVYANTEEQMRQLIAMGADGIFTNNPALLRKILDEN